MSTPAPQPGDVIAGKYRIESVLGRGGMGVVYAARHTLSERRVAVKWMEADLQNEPDALDRFVREARAMGRIEHPNVVGVLDVGTEGSIAYLVMDILRGESLRALMTRERHVPAALALATMFPVLEGVEAAHRAGVVHRDLKPENLFVVRGPDGEAQTTKVLDFGISKLTEHDTKKQDAKRLTKTGHVVGTPAYMSPEQVRGATIDARTDVWALSTILYEMLANRTPFEAANYGALLVAIATEPYTPLDPGLVAPDLARVIHRGLAKEPGDRWPSVLALARALRALRARREVRGAASTVARAHGSRTRLDGADGAERSSAAARAGRGHAGARPSRGASGRADADPSAAARCPGERARSAGVVASAAHDDHRRDRGGVGGRLRRGAAWDRQCGTGCRVRAAHHGRRALAADRARTAPERRADHGRAGARAPPETRPVVGLDPPPTASHVRHGTHAGTSAPPTTEAPPGPTTSTSRSGSISRDDF